MSRTDKDRPYRILIWDEGVFDHDHRQGSCVLETREHSRPGAVGRHRAARCPRWVEVWHEPYTYRFLFDDEVSVRPGYWGRKYDSSVACEYCESRLEWPTCSRVLAGEMTPRYYMWDNAPQWYRNSFERVARQESRLTLLDAVKDWNANGDTELEPDPYRHRHNANWYWM